MNATRRGVVIRILLLIARMYAEPEWKGEINTLATHIQVYSRELENK
jgi:hypothetical protein